MRIPSDSLRARGCRVAEILFDGKIVVVSHEIRGSWHWGRAMIADMAGTGRMCEIEIQNEFLIACVYGKPLAMVSDLITLLDRDNGEPLTAEMLTYGQRAKVPGYGGDPMLLRSESMAVLGPHAFGLKEELSPVMRVV